MRLDRNEKAEITKSLICHEKKGAFYCVISKRPMKSFKHVGKKRSFFNVRRMTLMLYREYIIGELGWRQEDQVSAFSKFQARKAETRCTQIVTERGQLT